jgi:hypothetical protein
MRNSFFLFLLIHYVEITENNKTQFINSIFSPSVWTCTIHYNERSFKYGKWQMGRARQEKDIANLVVRYFRCVLSQLSRGRWEPLILKQSVKSEEQKKTLRIWAHMCLPLFLIYTKIGSMDLFVFLSLSSEFLKRNSVSSCCVPCSSSCMLSLCPWYAPSGTHVAITSRDRSIVPNHTCPSKWTLEADRLLLQEKMVYHLTNLILPPYKY